MNVLASGSERPGADPLNLGSLADPSPEPGSLEKDWAMVSSALARGKKRRRQAWMGGLAAAASIALVIAVLGLPGPHTVVPQNSDTMTAEDPQPVTEPTGQPEKATKEPSLEELMAMSQDIENQLRFLRARVGGMSSGMVVYQVELQDVIGQIDDGLSLNPDSRQLWSQRLELQIDLMKLYRAQLRREHARLASL
jgi:hypothetical protein